MIHFLLFLIKKIIIFFILILNKMFENVIQYFKYVNLMQLFIIHYINITF